MMRATDGIMSGGESHRSIVMQDKQQDSRPKSMNMTFRPVVKRAEAERIDS